MISGVITIYDGDNLVVNGWIVYKLSDEWEVVRGRESKVISWLEDAIKYCLEN